MDDTQATEPLPRRRPRFWYVGRRVGGRGRCDKACAKVHVKRRPVQISVVVADILLYYTLYIFNGGEILWNLEACSGLGFLLIGDHVRVSRSWIYIEVCLKWMKGNRVNIPWLENICIGWQPVGLEEATLSTWENYSRGPGRVVFSLYWINPQGESPWNRFALGRGCIPVPKACFKACVVSRECTRKSHGTNTAVYCAWWYILTRTDSAPGVQGYKPLVY